MAKDNLGLVHVYTGDGKGKTSASMGLSLRAIGQGLKVYVIQFMKGGAYTGEFIAGKNFLPNIEMMQYGKPCIKEDKQYKLLGINEGYKYFDYVREDIQCGECRFCFVNDLEQKQYVKDAFERAKKVTTTGDYDLVVLDEVHVATQLKFLPVEELAELIKNKFKTTELILTGRGAHEKIIALADYVSVINMVKHPFEKGVAARRGIEY